MARNKPIIENTFELRVHEFLRDMRFGVFPRIDYYPNYSHINVIRREIQKELQATDRPRVVRDSDYYYSKAVTCISFHGIVDYEQMEPLLKKHGLKIGLIISSGYTKDNQIKIEIEDDIKNGLRK